MKIVDDQTPTPFFPFVLRLSLSRNTLWQLACQRPTSRTGRPASGIWSKNPRKSQQANPQGVTAPDRPGPAKVNSMASRIALRTPLSPTQSWYFGKTRKSGQRVVPGRRRLGLILGRSRR
jgi:hypothetical protein